MPRVESFPIYLFLLGCPRKHKFASDDLPTTAEFVQRCVFFIIGQCSAGADSSLANVTNFCVHAKSKIASDEQLSHSLAAADNIIFINFTSISDLAVCDRILHNVGPKSLSIQKNSTPDIVYRTRFCCKKLLLEGFISISENVSTGQDV